MKILIAPDSFKGSNTSLAVAKRIEAGVLAVFPDAETVIIPIADGGEGTVEALVTGAGGAYHTAAVKGPLGEERTATFGVLNNGFGVIEMAQSSGLPLVPDNRRDPLVTTTYGVGQLMKAALDKNCETLVLGIGGSATNDGGAGMAQALGVSFRDKNGRELGFGGGELENLAEIDISGIDPRIKKATVIVASDVNNPLCGERGASAVFGPQKGASPGIVSRLDRNLAHLADVVKRQLGADKIDIPGAGAAGGLGYGLAVFCGAVMKPGIETVLDAVEADKILPGCDLVITGEGRIDAQSAYGKVPVGVARRAKKYGVPVLAIVGDIGGGASAVYDFGVDSIMSSVNRAMPLEEAIANGGPLLSDCAERAMRMIKIGMSIKK